MYENEFTNAMTAIAESVSEADFDAISEGAKILMEEGVVSTMDEAVLTSAAMLYNEDAIGDEAYAITSAVIDEFANSTPVSYQDVISTLSESMSEEAFSEFMTEAVTAQLAKLSEAQMTPDELNRINSKLATQKGLAGKEKKAMQAKLAAHQTPAADPKAEARKAAVAGHKAARAAAESKKLAAAEKKGAVKGAAVGLAAAGAAYGGKKLYDKIKADKAAKEAEANKLSNKVKAKIEEGKAAAGEAVDKAKEKLAPKNERASEFYTLKDLRAIAESVSAPATEETEEPKAE